MTEEFKRVNVIRHLHLRPHSFYAFNYQKGVQRGGRQSERNHAGSHTIRRYQSFPLDGRKRQNMNAFMQPFLCENLCWTEGPPRRPDENEVTGSVLECYNYTIFI